LFCQWANFPIFDKNTPVPSSFILAMRWTARICSLAYVGFILFMFIAQTVPAFNDGQVQHFTRKEIISLSLLGLYCLCLLLAWKREGIFGMAGFLILAAFLFLVHAWSAPYFLIGFIPPALYILSNMLRSKANIA
jgi:hypothetical protein